MSCRCCQTSISKKQIVAVTGLLLILFVMGHLAGNLFFYGGPNAYNGYAKLLSGLRPGLYGIEIVLLIIFVIHMYMTGLLVMENTKARGATGYRVKKSQGDRSWATRLMPYTGTLIIVFIAYHLFDFTFADHHGPRSILADGKSYGVYGVVYNSFSDPVHSIFYVLAMFALSLHLSHGVQSFIQTFGFTQKNWAKTIQKISTIFSVVIGFAYSSIPVYVLLLNMK